MTPENPIITVDSVTTNFDTNTPPQIIDYTTNYLTNWAISPYLPTKVCGRCQPWGCFASNPHRVNSPSEMSHYADYLPVNIRQFLIHFRANWPCSVQPATNTSELLYGWSSQSSDDGTNGTWLLLSSPDPYRPQGLGTRLKFGDFGELVYFHFRDVITTNTAFSFLTVDTNLYALTNHVAGYNGQTFTNNVSGSISNLPVLPFGTPPGWLLANGLTGNLTNAETGDADKDGMLNWQEYQANTNPKDVNSKLTIRSFVQSSYDGRYQILFGSSVNRTYSVLWSTDFVNWQVVQDKISGTGTNITVIDPVFNPSDKLYYRVQVQ